MAEGDAHAFTTGTAAVAFRAPYKHHSATPPAQLPAAPRSIITTPPPPFYPPQTRRRTQVVVAAGLRGSLKVLDGLSGAVLREFPLPGGDPASCFLGQSNAVLGCVYQWQNQSRMVLWDVATSTVLSEFKSAQISRASASANGTVVSHGRGRGGGGRGCACARPGARPRQRWALSAAHPTPTIRHPQSPALTRTCTAPSPQLAAGNGDGSVRLWDMEGVVARAAQSPYVEVAADARRARRLSAEPSALPHIAIRGHCAHVLAISMSADGAKTLSCSADGMVVLVSAWGG